MSIIGTPLKKFFVFDVIIEPLVSKDEAGKPTYGDPVIYKGKIERQERQTRGLDQSTIRSRRLIYLYTTYTGITTDDRVTLPAGFEPLQPKLLDVRIAHDHNGVHHIVLVT